jgi:hypothetical protein
MADCHLWGHLTAIHDAMFPNSPLGERLHPELDAIFVSSPDKARAQLPHVGELRKYWDEVNGHLLSGFATRSAEELVAEALRNVRRRLCQRSDPLAGKLAAEYVLLKVSGITVLRPFGREAPYTWRPLLRPIGLPRR